MTAANIKQQLLDYQPFNEQEERDREQMLKFINNYNDVLTRENIFGHFCASAFIVNKRHTKMLMVYHLIFNGWIYPGGHADGEADLLSVAKREVKEETGLDAKIVDKSPFGLETIAVNGHVKHGKYVSAHNHYDFIYLMEADETEQLSYAKDEAKGIRWIDFADVDGKDIVPFARPVQRKLVGKLQTLDKKL